MSLDSDDEPLIGVGVVRFVDLCYASHPKLFSAIWASAAVCVLLVVFITDAALRRTLRRPGCMQRVYYRRILMLPMVFAVSSLLALCNPTLQLFMDMARKLFEAWVLSTFGLLFFMFLAVESVSLDGDNPRCRRLEGRNLSNIVTILNQEGPQKHFVAPPCCCLGLPFAAHQMGSRHIGLIVFMLRQYVIIAPTVSGLNLLVASSFSIKLYLRLQKSFLATTKVSALLCIWALFIMYRSSHHILQKYNMTAKFVAIKVFLILFIVQDYIVEVAVVRAIETAGRGSCFEEAGFRAADWGVVQARFVGSWLMIVETVVFAIAVKRAFPAEEIRAAEGVDFHHDLLDSCADELSMSDG